MSEPKALTEDKLKSLLDDGNWPIVLRWLERGDGCAVYTNADMGSKSCGHRQFISFGSDAAQLPGDDLPVRMPDIGADINWAYQLEGTCRRLHIVRGLAP